ncbi:DUF2768 domain-containing protein [Ectobacillus ponti]|uniref:DUF2768 domain-containing protein n=1 Tax=Ectobacillus ponti TaxID=2961894 RepID=A0AA41X7T3_9BACI|nr:DUF2768 domain-containing protein [Ectobacillus ponti]MCP8968748.1 DUF2768 domain-containing protein [Ectobacillus ponti]
MSLSMLKMWLSFGAMGAMAVSILFIMLSRYRLRNVFLKGITAVVAYVLMITSGLVMFYLVFSGPTN